MIFLRGVLNLDGEMKLVNIGQNIKHFRKLRGLTQEKVAEIANISTGYYQSLESRNEESPSLETLMKICMALNVPIEFIVKDCGIELFQDFCDYKIKTEIKNSKTKKLVSSALLNIYDFLNDLEDNDRNSENTYD